MIQSVAALSLEECQKEAARCIGCGLCLTVCPVFGEDPREELTARGRNARLPALIAETGRQGLDEALSKCLLCGRCAMICPRGIHNDRIVATLRAAAVERHGLPLFKRAALRALLADRKAMAKALGAAALFQKLLPPARGTELGRGDDGHLPPVRHLPLFFAGLAGGRHLPPICQPFLSERLPERTPAAGEKGPPLRAAFFSGCAMEFMLPAAAAAMVDLLSKLGVEVLFPKGQGCCGLAMHANGDTETALAMARHNADVLEACEADIIVTGCATCGSALRDAWPHLDAPAGDRARFAAIAAKTRDFSEVLMERSFPEPFPYVSALPPDVRAAWHSPCHLAFHQRVSREPVTLLQRALGRAFRPLPSRCCGFGGSFNAAHYPLSKAIGVNKINDLRETNAQYIITACPGCMIQLTDLMAQHALSGKVIHLAEALTLR